VILVFVEHDDGAPAESSLETVAAARRLGGEVEAVVIGESGRAAAEQLGAHGVRRLRLVVDERLDDYAPEAWAACVVEAAAGATLVLAAGTDRGQEVLAHASARLDAPFAANCVGVEAGEPLRVVRQRWGGSLLEEAELSGSVVLLAVVPHAFAAESAEGVGAAEVVEVRTALTDEHFRARVVQREEPQVGQVLLTDAKVVVGGGRGVGSAEGFAALEELAGLLGGAVGGSRVVTNLGWRSHADQIGQTGARIAPELYIACGISGAIQHMVGCKAAKRILAINKDPHAPMVAHADYAVIGDLEEIVPAVVAELSG
jgi:electron transfer flavoprotein alpha subunit